MSKVVTKITSPKHPGAVFVKYCHGHKDAQFLCKFYPTYEGMAHCYIDALNNQGSIHAGLIVYMAAQEYFENCLDDFCLQHPGDECIIFGGTNRLIWRAKTGFKADASYCTPEFLAHFEEVQQR